MKWQKLQQTSEIYEAHFNISLRVQSMFATQWQRYTFRAAKANGNDTKANYLNFYNYFTASGAGHITIYFVPLQ